MVCLRFACLGACTVCMQVGRARRPNACKTRTWRVCVPAKRLRRHLWRGQPWHVVQALPQWYMHVHVPLRPRGLQTPGFKLRCALDMRAALSLQRVRVGVRLRSGQRFGLALCPGGNSCCLTALPGGRQSCR